MPPNYQFFDGKVILRIRNTICDTPEELLSTDMFGGSVQAVCDHALQAAFAAAAHLPGPGQHQRADLHQLAQTLRYLVKLPANLVQKIVDGSEPFSGGS